MALRRCIGFMAVAVSAAACHCRGGGVGQLDPAVVVLSPTQLTLPATYVGSTRTGRIEVSNHGGAPAVLAVGPLVAPFSVMPQMLEVSRGETQTLEVTFAPAAAGQFSATLELADQTVALSGEGLAVPACLPSGVCVEAHFDESAGTCNEGPLPDGTACATKCVSGTCTGSVCLGQLTPCGDTNACTIDACSDEVGCIHTARTCASPLQACRLARCDMRLGCVEEAAPDGTLCGVDDCLATQVDVCIAGQCTKRPRPDDGRCANRWLPVQLPSGEHVMAYDVARSRAVLFDFYTWESMGSGWTLRIPAASPSQRSYHAMAWDSARSRVLLFGGRDPNGQPLDDTWEWDGTNWVERPALTPPPKRRYHAAAYDEARQRLVVFGGWGGPTDDLLDDTWEWDGSAWTQPMPMASPSPRAHPTLAYDTIRQRVVLFGGWGSGGELDDTWEWDGQTWTRRSPTTSPPKRAQHAMAFDPQRGRTVVFGGNTVVMGNYVGLGDTWEWDGTEWRRSTPAVSPPVTWGHTMAYDPVVKRVLLVNGAATWEWDGVSWAQRPQTVTPAPRYDFAVTYDPVRRRAVLFGGQPPAAVDTWEWSANGWSPVTPADAPSPRWRSQMVFDAARQRTVLFGGSGNGPPAGTWEWDGVTWVDRASAGTGPGSRDRFAMAYDAARQRTVLFGGDQQGDTWEWDGTTWLPRTPSPSPPARWAHAMAYDAAHQRVVLFGGTNPSNVPLEDTWEWDGSTWALRLDGGSPGGPSGAYDVGRQKIVVPGAVTSEWDGTGWTQRTPVTPPPARCAVVYATELEKVVCFSPASSSPYVYLP